MDTKQFADLPRPIALVVDDEPLILMDTADTVSDEGYAVIEVTSAQAAYEFLEKHPSLELLFTDVQTPGRIDGFELARKVATQWPDICIVVASGAAKPRPSDLPATAVFVSKPLSAQLVHETIRKHCGRDAGNAVK